MLQLSGALACTRDELFSDPETLALAASSPAIPGSPGRRTRWTFGFRRLAAAHELRLFEVRRAHIEAFARELEARGGRGPRSHAGSAPSSACTGTPNKKD